MSGLNFSDKLKLTKPNSSEHEPDFSRVSKANGRAFVTDKMPAFAFQMLYLKFDRVGIALSTTVEKSSNLRILI
ncbi:hypothetical protein [Pedobacter agri]|uniref:hypothetical protein n=1 Tax=Pedobacter agri TaxID=454586 RepID=UPI00292D3357|nr:hypothetical protein [Pedobacter agri]